MSNGALPKHHPSTSSLSGHLNIQNCNSELFELKPKPKLTCIPKTCTTTLLKDLRKTQSLDVYQKVDHPEKSWSVLYVGSKFCEDDNKKMLI